jgi:hypothetical protein
LKLLYKAAPWVSRPPDRDLLAAATLTDGAWRESAVEFYAVRTTRLRQGRQAPKGIQPFLNDVLDRRFEDSGWEGVGGRYRIRDSWLRITFRHSMSLGADFLDALRLARKEGVRQAAIAAASEDFLRLISPNDAKALVSFERVWAQASELDGVFDCELFIGRLTPASALPPEVSAAIARERPRDRYLPSVGAHE